MVQSEEKNRLDKSDSHFCSQITFSFGDIVYIALHRFCDYVNLAHARPIAYWTVFFGLY